MKLKEVRKRLSDIEKNRWDTETAHIMQDELLLDFVRFVANGEHKTISNPDGDSQGSFKSRGYRFSKILLIKIKIT